MNQYTTLYNSMSMVLHRYKLEVKSWLRKKYMVEELLCYNKTSNKHQID